MDNNQLIRNNYFILTGAMGGGKSTILAELRKLGLTAIDEPARQILAEQRNIGGVGVPEQDPQLFTDLLLSRAIFQYNQFQDHPAPIIFDRGIPDNICYANFFDLSTTTASAASKQYRYNSKVFYVPGWKEIYQTDDERKMTFEQANQFGVEVKAIYNNLKYQIIEVPFDTPSARARFIMETIQKLHC